VRKTKTEIKIQQTLNSRWVGAHYEKKQGRNKSYIEKGFWDKTINPSVHDTAGSPRSLFAVRSRCPTKLKRSEVGQWIGKQLFGQAKVNH